MDTRAKCRLLILDQGTYQITELKTKDGNALLKEPIIVTLPMTMTADEANEYGNVDFSSAKEDKITLVNGISMNVYMKSPITLHLRCR